MKIIDAHLHFCLTEDHFFLTAEKAGHENSIEHLKMVYQENNIVHGIVMGNRDLSFERHQYPPFLSYCIGLDSAYLSTNAIADSIPMVEGHLKNPACVGIKLYPGYCQTYVTDPAYFPLYELAAYYHKPVAIHTGATANGHGILKYCHPATLDELAVQYPSVQFVMCHLGNPWLIDAAAVIQKNTNVAADLSGLLEGIVNIPQLIKEQSGYISYLKTWIAYIQDYDRLLYGTDWPLVNIINYIDFIRFLIPEKYHEKIFYENARRIYGISI